jgi:hypothetical protein
MADEMMQEQSVEEQNPFDTNYDTESENKSTTYNPDEGKFGPKPYGEFTPDGYQDGGQQRQYQAPSAGQQPQQEYEQGDPLGEVADFMDEKELQFVGSLPPEQQGYFVNAINRIKSVYEHQAGQIEEYAENVKAIAEDVLPLKEVDDFLGETVMSQGFESTPDYIEALVVADMEFSKDPYNAMLHLMEHYGMKFGDLYDAAAAYTEKVSDPYYIKSQKLEEERRSYENYATELEEQQAAAEQAEIMGQFQEEINNFANEVDENGYETHPYFALVDDQMAKLLAATGNYDLEDLYEQCCWADPDIRADILENGGYEGGYENFQPQAQPSAAQFVNKFATGNSASGSTYYPNPSEETFEDTFNRNWARVKGNSL